MSWYVSASVVDGNTEALREVAENYFSANGNESMKEQAEFAIGVVESAFEAEVVEGLYNVSISGHTDPEQENDRKSLNISFNPSYEPAEVS